jgi:hypothetical protein
MNAVFQASSGSGRRFSRLFGRQATLAGFTKIVDLKKTSWQTGQLELKIGGQKVTKNSCYLPTAKPILFIVWVAIAVCCRRVLN